MSSPVFSWPLTVPAYQQPGNVPSYLQPGAGTAGPDPRYLTEADLLAVLDRVYPEWYLEPLKDPGPGYEIYQAYAKMLERASLAVGRFENANLIMYSHGAAHSVASVEFYRQNASAGAFTILKGTVCRTSKTNRSYVAAADVSFGASDLIVAAQVTAIAPGPEYDVAGPVFTADGTLLPGEIDTVVIPLLNPVFAEPTLQVRQIGNATGGQHPVLDQHGLDRNLPRLPNENDSTYKGRIRQLPDTVSPAAIRRQLDAVFLPLGLSYQLIETWMNEYQSCWDAPNETLVHPMMGTLAVDTWSFDDTRTTPFRGRWMDEHDCPAGYVLVVPNVTSWEMRGFAYDDVDADLPAEFVTALGRRATSAYDAPDVDTAVIFAPAYDGGDRLKDLFYLRIWDLLKQIKGGGLHVAIELQGQ